MLQHMPTVGEWMGFRRGRAGIPLQRDARARMPVFEERERKRIVFKQEVRDRVGESAVPPFPRGAGVTQRPVTMRRGLSAPFGNRQNLYRAANRHPAAKKACPREKGKISLASRKPRP